MWDMSLLWVMSVVSIVLILLLILFQQKYALLHKTLHKTTEDYNQLASKFDGINSLKNQLEQQIIKAQTESQGLQIRLNERDEKIYYLTQELDEEQARKREAKRQKFEASRLELGGGQLLDASDEFFDAAAAWAARLPGCWIAGSMLSWIHVIVPRK